MKLRNHVMKMGAVVCAMALTVAATGAAFAQGSMTQTSTTPTTDQATVAVPTTPSPLPPAPAEVMAQPGTAPAATTPAVDTAAAQQQVQDLVKSAAEYIKNNGKDAAIAEFNKKNGLFSKGSYYIFSVDYMGMSLADYNNPELVGKNQYELKSEDGKSIVKDAIALAKAGGGWFQYRWKDPVTQQITCKKSYVMGINNSYLIGSGYYYPPGPDGVCAP